jgi:serine/threonine protein phosphatase PrpC
MKFTVYQESRLGRRKTNQDRFTFRYTREALLMVVSDGMGGHANGEVAAEVATGFIAEAFGREANPKLDHPFIFLSQILSGAHQAILDAARSNGLAEPPRTTCVVCVVQDGAAYWAHSGDSRLYLLRGGEILARTRDHSKVQFLLDQGLIDAEEAKTHRDRNQVTSCLGGERSPQVTCSRKTPLKAGDVLALCTDGAWAPLAGEDLAKALCNADVMNSVPAFLDRVEAAAGSNGDNATIVAMCWEADATADGMIDTDIAELDEIERGRAVEPELSDEDIEIAVATIRAQTPYRPT